MSSELTKAWTTVAEFPEPIRNFLIAIFLTSILTLVGWVQYSSSEMSITWITIALFWSGYLLMIEIGYGQGLSIGRWTYQGREEIEASALWFQIYAALVLFCCGIVLTISTVEILQGSVR